jgi:hypothetical protein
MASPALPARHVYRPLRVLILAFLMSAAPVAAQPTVRVQDRGTCARCRIALRLVVALGAEDGTGSITSVDAEAIRTK